MTEYHRKTLLCFRNRLHAPETSLPEAVSRSQPPGKIWREGRKSPSQPGQVRAPSPGILAAMVGHVPRHPGSEAAWHCLFQIHRHQLSRPGLNLLIKAATRFCNEGFSTTGVPSWLCWTIPAFGLKQKQCLTILACLGLTDEHFDFYSHRNSTLWWQISL